MSASGVGCSVAAPPYLTRLNLALTSDSALSSVVLNSVSQ